jgi:hypothetical protein
VRVTHPFHPLFGRVLDAVERRHNWAEDRVFFVGDDGQLRSVPAGWTDIDPPDPFVVIADGRSPFRAGDLVALAELLEGIRPAKPHRRVKRSSPSA